jgi:hypothetical protein
LCPINSHLKKQKVEKKNIKRKDEAENKVREK